MRSAGISWGRGPTLHGHIPSSLQEIEPLASDALRFAEHLGVDSGERAPAIKLVGRVAEAGHFPETVDALSAPFHVPGITKIVEKATPGTEVDSRLAALTTLTSEAGLAACDSTIPHVSPVEIKSPAARLEALCHPAAGSLFVAEVGLPIDVAIMVGNRHSREPTPVSHGVGGLPDDLRPTFDVSAAALALAEWENRGKQPDEAAHVYHRLQLLFDDTQAYGEEGGRRIVEVLCEDYGLAIADDLAPAEQPVTWGVGIQSRVGDLGTSLLLPTIGTAEHRLVLPFRGSHFEHLPQSDEIADRVLESA